MISAGHITPYLCSSVCANERASISKAVPEIEANAVTYIRGGSYFPYILLNEIQTMFSQLAKRSARVLPADLCTDHTHYVENHR